MSDQPVHGCSSCATTGGALCCPYHSPYIPRGQMSAIAEVARIVAERDRYKRVLERIANADYRGNRSHESQLAWHALNEPQA